MTHENIVLAAFFVVAIASGLGYRAVLRRHATTPPRQTGPGWLALATGNLLALATLVGLALGLGEIHFRFVHDETDSFGLSKTSRAWLARHHGSNAEGFRDSVDYGHAYGEGRSATHEDRRVVTFLGDSFLAGYGVPDVEDRFANRLRRSHPEWDVRVLAELGADTASTTRILRDWIARGVSIGDLVLVYCLNDIQSVAPEAAAHDARILDYRRAERPYPIRHSFLLDRLYHLWLVRRDPALDGYFDFLDRAYRGPAWAVQADRLRALVDVARDAGGRIRVVTFPFLHDTQGPVDGPDYPFREAHEILARFWRDEGIPHLDLREAYAGRIGVDLVVNRHDAHPNEEAHAIAAHAIETFLEARVPAQVAARSRTRRGLPIWPARDAGVILGDVAPQAGASDPERTAHGGLSSRERVPTAGPSAGLRDVWLFEHAGRYHLHFDRTDATGWRASHATSTDFSNWTHSGPILELGRPGRDDSAAAAYGVPYFDGRGWHLFYLGTPNASTPPERIPALPYNTLKAVADSPTGPWQKRYDVVPFRPTPGTWYADTASPGPILRRDTGYLQFMSGAVRLDGRLYRSLGLARSDGLDGSWAIDPMPILPITEQVENASLYYEAENETWFLFTNRVHVSGRFTDAIVVYWSKDVERWSPTRKAVVLDGRSSSWSHAVIGLPSVLPVGRRLAVAYDGVRGNGTSHVGREIGLAWLPLPLVPPNAVDEASDAASQSSWSGRPRRWELESSGEWDAIQQLAARVDEGRLLARVTAPFDDPYLVLAGPPIWASEYDQLRFRARLDPAPRGHGNVYFFRGGEHAAVDFEIVPGWHDYRIDLARSPDWAGRIDRLRLDLPDGDGATYAIELDWIELTSRRRASLSATARAPDSSATRSAARPLPTDS